MPFYGLDRGIDKAFVDWGIKDPGTVAHERASEALDATEAGNNEARDRALHRLNEIAENTSSNNTKGLTKAQAVLEALQQRTPDETDTGISTHWSRSIAYRTKRQTHPIDQAGMW